MFKINIPEHKVREFLKPIAKFFNSAERNIEHIIYYTEKDGKYIRCNYDNGYSMPSHFQQEIRVGDIVTDSKNNKAYCVSRLIHSQQCNGDVWATLGVVIEPFEININDGYLGIKNE